MLSLTSVVCGCYYKEFCVEVEHLCLSLVTLDKCLPFTSVSLLLKGRYYLFRNSDLIFAKVSCTNMWCYDVHVEPLGTIQDLMQAVETQ